MRFLAATSIAFGLLIAPAAVAQERGSVTLKERQAAENEANDLKWTSLARVPLEKPIKGAPYSGETIVQATQTLADGNHINRQSTGRVFRDGEGRVRREEDKVFSVKTASGVASGSMTGITIVDPVGGYSYSLDTEHKIAWRTPMETGKKLLDELQALREAKLKQDGAPTSGQNASAEAEAKAAARLKEELAAKQADEQKARAQIPLEHKTIEGLAVEGHTSTETIPAGAIGNDQPIVITSEEWRSTDLKVLVLTRHNDPRTGESTYRLANVVRAEPDPSLFMVPPDFTVKDTGIRRNPN